MVLSLYIGSTESLKGDDWKDFSTRFKAIAIEKPSPRIRLSKRLQKELEGTQEWYKKIEDNSK